jgi:hypothetical protein
MLESNADQLLINAYFTGRAKSEPKTVKTRNLGSVSEDENENEKAGPSSRTRALTSPSTTPKTASKSKTGKNQNV